MNLLSMIEAIVKRGDLPPVGRPVPPDLQARQDLDKAKAMANNTGRELNLDTYDPKTMQGKSAAELVNALQVKK